MLVASIEWLIITFDIQISRLKGQGLLKLALRCKAFRDVFWLRLASDTGEALKVAHIASVAAGEAFVEVLANELRLPDDLAKAVRRCHPHRLYPSEYLELPPDPPLGQVPLEL